MSIETPESYIARNAASRERLVTMVATLDAAACDRSVGHGWTVKVTLAHIAYWDRYAAERLVEWQRDGAANVRWRTGSADEVNDAMLPGWLTASSGNIAREVVAAAELVDGVVERLPEATVEEVLASRPRLLVRALHRNEHLDEVWRALNG